MHARSLTKVFGRGEGSVVALDSMDIDLADGEFVVFLGPSGSGKTTFLRLVAGLEVATSGRVYIGDHDVTTVHPRERNIAMVFQDYALYPHMTVRENLSFGLSNLKYPRKEIDARISEVVAMLGMEGLLERRPRQLSGGQRQRVAVGRAVVRRPDVFLFDEPLSNLDAKLRGQVRVELAQLHQRLSTTTVYVTHDQVEAMTLGQRIVLLDHGLVQQIGTGSDLYNNPQTMFVAQFIGSPAMNLMPGELVLNGQDEMFFQTGQLRLKIPNAYVSGYRPNIGQKTVLGLRSHHMEVWGASGEPDPASTAKVRITPSVIEELGEYTLLYFELEGTQITGKLDPENGCRVGEEVDLALQLNRMSLFDADSEQVIARPAVSEPEAEPVPQA